jgi:1-phosphofructokinase
MNPALDKTVTVDGIALARLNRIKEVRMDAGGKGINVAKVLRGFQVDVAAWGIAGGYQGRLIQDKLQAQGIPCFFLEGAGETRVNMKVVDESTKLTTEFNEPGVEVNGSQLAQFTDRFLQGIAGVSYVVLGGSLPPGAPSGYYRTLIEAAAAKNVPVILDADGEALAQGMEAAPYAVKPNIHELENYFGCRLQDDREIVNAARSLIAAKGVQLVQVSMGGNGSILVDGQEAHRAKPFPIVPVSTVGAGDSMVAAMVYGLLHQLPLSDISRLTSAAGTITASKAGTQVCTIQEVKEKQDSVELIPI